MRSKLMAAALAASLSLSLGACERPGGVAATYSNSSGSLALSRDDALVYAVDTDSKSVIVVDAQTSQVVATVPVGPSPARIVVGPDDTLYVSNRGGRSVSVIRRASTPEGWREAARVDVGVEPVGLAVAPDNSTLYVVNSTSLDNAEVGTLTAIDVASLQVRWEVEVGPEPRGISLAEEGRAALVTLYKTGEVVKVDLQKGQVVTSSATLYQKVNASVAQARTSGMRVSTFHPRGTADVVTVTTPHWERAFVPVTWAREDEIATPPTALGGYYSNGGPCNLGSIASSGLITLEASDLDPKVDDLGNCLSSSGNSGADYPPTLMGTFDGQPMQGASAAVATPFGDYLWVVNRETKNVAVLKTGSRFDEGVNFGFTGTSVRFVVPVFDGADGIALARDGRRAWVYSQFDHVLSRIEQVGESSDAHLARTEDVKLAGDGLPMEVVAGRKLFHDAASPTMSATGTNVACSSCHLEGREDGHVWKFPDGPRQTPSLAGRMMSQTAPFHWSGEFPSMEDFFDHTVRFRMGGAGVSARELEHLIAFMDAQEAPDNPHRAATLTEAQTRGKQVFQEAGCEGCHAGATLTNNTNADVGTLVSTDTVMELNTPSLLTLARTAPYLHDGTAGTLKARLMATKDTDLHGTTSGLTEAQMDDLVAYLQSL